MNHTKQTMKFMETGRGNEKELLGADLRETENTGELAVPGKRVDPFRDCLISNMVPIQTKFFLCVDEIDSRYVLQDQKASRFEVAFSFSSTDLCTE